ncbi:hypothetical protein [Frondihabitans sp. Leaf304]|uniref:hypothetical protein n=1 Tax=Frondihabitans sp. Leaf304 TaxID=1736329 RepID=UPI0012F84E26|nr:hypothetical protein [Frondihabitans sp. Leaf304]
MNDDPEAFRVRDAEARGLTPAALRRVEWELPFHGIRRWHRDTGPPRGVRDRVVDLCRALLPALPEGAFFSHVTAAILWGLPLPAALESHDAPLHVTTRSGNALRRRGVVGHLRRSAPPHVLRAGIPVSTPIDTWVDCRATLDDIELVVVGDALAGEWSPYRGAHHCDPSDLVAAARKAIGKGSARLRRAATRIRAGSKSPQETRLRLALVESGLPEPEINVTKYGPDGAWLGAADLAYDEHRLAIEYEGDYHRTDRDQWFADIARRERFDDAGWRTARVTAADMRHLDALCTRIARLHRERTP